MRNRTSKETLLCLGALLVFLGASAGCLPPAGGSDADNVPPPDVQDPDRDSDDVSWPPELESVVDTGDAGPEGGRLELLDGEIELEIPAGALADPVNIEVNKRIVQVKGVDLVGYIWGPHGTPIDPVGKLTIETTSDSVPPWVSEPRSARLYLVRDGEPELLQNATADVTGDVVLLEGDLPMLGDVFIGPMPEE